MSSNLAAHFPITDLSHISDDITDGLNSATDEMPLSHFDALRVDFSLARLKHYTGTHLNMFNRTFFSLIITVMSMNL